MAEILDELIIAFPGAPRFVFTGTIVSHCGAILRDVEDRYGPRDRTFTLLGIEFGTGNPQIWFPGDCNHVVIQLGPGARTSVAEALFQLAHECIHLLNPVKRASVLEEGLATSYQLEYIRQLNLGSLCSDPKYMAAAKIVDEMLAVRRDAVRALRTPDRGLSTLTADEIRAAVPGGAFDADALALPFVDWRPF